MKERRTTTPIVQAADTSFDVIRILSDSNRILILRLLSENQELCARDILSFFPITQPTLSHHMNVLLDNHLVEARKSGRWVFYRLSLTGIQKIIDFFETLKNTAYIPNRTISYKPVPQSTHESEKSASDNDTSAAEHKTKKKDKLNKKDKKNKKHKKKRVDF